MKVENFIFSGRSTAAMLSITTQHLNRLVREKVIPKEGRDRYDLRAVFPAFIAHREAIAGEARVTPADERVRAARAREIELRIARQERELIPLDEALHNVDLIAGAMLTEYSSLPAQIARDDRQHRQRIEDVIYRSRERLAAKFDSYAKEIKSGLPADQQEDDDE